MFRILIVDDNRPFVLAISESLHFRGYQVSSASDGASALVQVAREIPDLVLLDIEMPGMDGLNFCTALRADPRYRSIPVIFMSVRSDLSDKLAAYDAGADDYLVKPFDMRELGARLQAVLRRSAQQAADQEQRNATQEAPPAVTAASGEAVDEADGEAARMLQVGPVRLHLDNATLESPAGSSRLTPAEFDLLKFFLLHANQILSSERLLQEVWLYPAGVGDPAVVRWHVKNLRRKLEVEPEKPTYLRTISHHGYILSADVPANRA
jgi:DNA-binding response OmpR family regulator